MNKETKQKREELATYIQTEVLNETAVQGIIVIGSVAKGTARSDSDIDAIVFLDPYDLYAVPAEAYWIPDTNEFISIFANAENPIQLDFHRLDLQKWSQPGFEWPESICAELSEGWIAFDRNDQMQQLLARKTVYSEEIRQARLDESFVKIDWLLTDTQVERTWDTLGSGVAQYRLHSAFEFLVQALFAYNRRWRTWRSRELTYLLRLAWLPTGFHEQFLLLTNALSETKTGYLARAKALLDCFEQVVAICQQDGLYGENAISEAFIRSNNEPGRSWNMDEWNKNHNDRKRRLTSTS